MLVFEERGKPEYLEKNLSEQRREPTTNSTHIWRRRRFRVGLVSVYYLFYQRMAEKIKTWTLRFPAQENPNMEKALFGWPIVL